MRFNLEQLRAFTTAVDKGSFSAAAREMGKAQSAISTMISNLEVDLGLVLFDRSRREPRLTEAGQSLLSEAQALLLQAQMFEGHADSMAAGEEGRLSLAVEESLIGDSMQDLLQRFERTFPLLELELMNPARMDIINLVTQGRIDIGLLMSTLEAPKGYYLKPLKQMLVIAAVSPQHPLADFDDLSFDDLMKHRQLVLTSREGKMYPNEQISSRVWKIESQFGLIDLLTGALGWAWVPQHMAEPFIERGRLKKLCFSGGPESIHLPVDLVISSRYREGKAGHWLFRELANLSFLV